MDYFTRKLNLSLPAGQSAFLWGARKTGKSTFLRKHFAASAYFDLLSSELFLSYSKRPSLFREHVLALPDAAKGQPIVIDEAQRVPLLFDEVHRLIEDKHLSFILCGSSARKLKRGRANLLGGRAWRYELSPLVSDEIPEFDLLQALNTGLVPSHYLSSEPQRSLQAYVADYLQEEIRAEGLTRNLPAFSRFLDAVGFSANQLVNYTNIARECGVDAKTAKEYFQILVDTHIGYLLEPFVRSRGRQVITATPKFYLFDVGVTNRLTGTRIGALRGAEAGRAFENFIHMELVAYNSYRQKEVALNYWRTKTRLEVDFVLSNTDNIVAIEAKIGKHFNKADFRGLNAILEQEPQARAYLVCNENRPRVVELGGSREVHVLPFREFLARLWADDIY